MIRFCNRFLPLAYALMCLSPTARPQQSWSATVAADKAPVYRDIGTQNEILTTLSNGSQVNVYFSVRSIQGSWCKIGIQDDRQNYGFVLCSQLHRAERAPAAGASATRDTGASSQCVSLADGLMEASGADAEFSLLSQQFVSALLAGSAQGMRAQERADVTAILQRDLDSNVLGAEVHRNLVRHCEPATYSEALDAFRVPLVAKMVKLETKPTGATGGHNTDSPERVALFRRIDHAQGNTQFMVDLTTEMFVAMVGSMAGKTPTKTEIDSLRSQMAQTLRPILMTAYSLVYRPASDDELGQYAAAWESGPLRKYNGIYQRAFSDVMQQQAQVVGADLRSYLDAHRRTGSPR